MFSSLILVTLTTTLVSGKKHSYPKAMFIKAGGFMDALTKDISNGLEKVPICVDVGPNEELPAPFTYTTSCVGGPDVTLKDDPSYLGCVCKDVCNDDRYCHCLAGYGPNYEKRNETLLIVDDKRLKMDGYTRPLFECNSLCCCPQFCGNRLVQNGITLRLQVFKTADKDWGLRTLDNIHKGQFVCEYAGEIITYDEAKKRTVSQEGNNYIIVIKEHMTASYILHTYVDPKYHGNVGRFINHSCDPNLVMNLFRVDSSLPILALFSNKDIPAGAELSFDYSGGSSVSKNNQLGDQNCVSNIMKVCLCKSTKCIGYLPCDLSLFAK